MDSLTKEDCTLYQAWKASTNGCCADGRPHAGYSKAHAPVTICVDGVLKIACSLTDEPNIYYPLDGLDMTPPTWEVKSIDQHIKDLMCQSLAYGYGVDPGNETIEGHYQYKMEEQNLLLHGGMTLHTGNGVDGDAGAIGFKVPTPGVYRVRASATAEHKSGVADNPNLFIGTYLNGETFQTISGSAGDGGVFASRFILQDGGEVPDGASRTIPRERIMYLNAGDTITVATVPGANYPGFAGHQKGFGELSVEQLSSCAGTDPNY